MIVCLTSHLQTRKKYVFYTTWLLLDGNTVCKRGMQLQGSLLKPRFHKQPQKHGVFRFIFFVPQRRSPIFHQAPKQLRLPTNSTVPSTAARLPTQGETTSNIKYSHILSPRYSRVTSRRKRKRHQCQHDCLKNGHQLNCNAKAMKHAQREITVLKIKIQQLNLEIGRASCREKV